MGQAQWAMDFTYAYNNVTFAFDISNSHYVNSNLLHMIITVLCIYLATRDEPRKVLTWTANLEAYPSTLGWH